tara:strand:- start:1647 stop:2174 length:528 start_codon:yes stop_codon:yes gene_type:complete
MKTFNISLLGLPLLLFSTLAFTASEHLEEGHDGDHEASGVTHEERGEHGSVGERVMAMQDTHTIKVTLNDQMKILFNEELSEIESGSVIQFAVSNEGRIPHEFSISSLEEQEEHAEMMRKMPNMVHDDKDGNTLTVQPGAIETITWRFEGDEMVVFACNIPGHFDAGMFKKIELK